MIFSGGLGGSSSGGTAGAGGTIQFLAGTGGASGGGTNGNGGLIYFVPGLIQAGGSGASVGNILLNVNPSGKTIGNTIIGGRNFVAGARLTVNGTTYSNTISAGNYIASGSVGISATINVECATLVAGTITVTNGLITGTTC